MIYAFLLALPNSIVHCGLKYQPRRRRRSCIPYCVQQHHMLPERLLCNTFLLPATSSQPPEQQHHIEPFTLLVLNYDIPAYTLKLWHRDGGANRLYDLAHALAPKDPNAHLTYLPDIVVGDLDSLRPDVRTAYTTAGVQVVNESNQDTTDLQKSLTYASRLLAPQVTLCPLGTNRDGGYPRLRPVVIAAGALGGRLDHTIANLASLIRYPQLRVVLMGDGNLAQVVPPGCSTIMPVPGVEGPTCGLVPLFGDVVCTTQGLRWNLTETPMSMTGLISTSNLIDEEHVHVESNAPLLWTVEWRI